MECGLGQTNTPPPDERLKPPKISRSIHFWNLFSTAMTNLSKNAIENYVSSLYKLLFSSFYFWPRSVRLHKWRASFWVLSGGIRPECLDKYETL